MKIILDIDDVLADTVAALEQEWGPAVDPTSVTIDDFFPGVDLSQHLHSPAFNLAIPPIEGAVEGARRIFKAGHEILYVSARIPGLSKATQTWLQTWVFPDNPLHCVGREGKTMMMQSIQYDLLIDDQLKYLKIAEQRGLRAMAYAYLRNDANKEKIIKDFKSAARLGHDGAQDMLKSINVQW